MRGEREYDGRVQIANGRSIDDGGSDDARDDFSLSAHFLAHGVRVHPRLGRQKLAHLSVTREDHFCMR